jgi:hypothetical protein
MTNNLYEMETELRRPEVFEYIPEGIAAYDVNGKKVGTVKHFQAPSTSAYPELTDFPLALRSNSMPDELIFRILNAGFICINAGFLAKDRFAFLHQIDHVKDDEVHLVASMDDLIKA